MLSERQHKILSIVIDNYVSDGVPVSSQKIKDSVDLGISTATIRSIMAELEESGYLTKPHTSAGRIPADEGYRYYVNELLAHLRINRKLVDLFRQQIREQAVDIGTIMAGASRFLGRISRNFSVVYGSILRESRVSRINLLELEGMRLLVVVNLLPEFERTTTLRLDRRFPPEVISRAEQLINQVVHGKTLDQAKNAIDAVVRDNLTGEGIITREVAINREAIFSEPPAIELYFEEREPLFDQSELYDPNLLQLLLRLLHNKTYMTSILVERLAEKTQITIGAENEDQTLRPFSLVTAGYRMGGARGVLGIIGPTRMRYELVLGLVDSVAKELREMGEKYF